MAVLGSRDLRCLADVRICVDVVRFCSSPARPPCKPGRLINQTCHFLQYCRLKQRSLSERTASWSAKVAIPLGSGAHFSDRPFRAASPDLQKWPFSLIRSPCSASAACHRTRSGALRLCSWPPGVHVQLASQQLPPRAAVAIFLEDEALFRWSLPRARRADRRSVDTAIG